MAKEAYTYRVNKEMRDVIERESMDLEPLVEVLKTRKWKAKTTESLKGRSGVNHTFALLASPLNSPFYVKDNSDIVVPRLGGEGAFRLLLDLLLYIQKKAYLARNDK